MASRSAAELRRSLPRRVWPWILVFVILWRADPGWDCSTRVEILSYNPSEVTRSMEDSRIFSFLASTTSRRVAHFAFDFFLTVSAALARLLSVSQWRYGI